MSNSNNQKKRWIVDTHCHFFHFAKFAFREVMSILLAYVLYSKRRLSDILGDHDEDSDNTDERDENANNGKDETLDALGKILQQLTLETIIGNYRSIIKRSTFRNYRYEQKQFAKSDLAIKKGIFRRDKIITIPLMMDVFYMLESTACEDLNSEKPEPKDPEQVIEDIIIAIEYIIAKLDNKEFIANLNQKISELNKIKKIFLKISKKLVKRISKIPIDEMSWGYDTHMKELERLKCRYPKRVYPFLAVDPRRPKILELIKEKVITKSKPYKKPWFFRNGRCFQGIKLYPALGYLPSHPNLLPVYQYCEQNDIPIIVHCGFGGFVPKNWLLNLPVPGLQIACRRKGINDDEEGYPHETIDYNNNEHRDRFCRSDDQSQFWIEVFGAPKYWEPVLKQHSNLRINLGHFGAIDEFAALADLDPASEDYLDEQNKNWTYQIIKLMKKPEYTNLYADLSFYPFHDKLQKIEIILDKYDGEANLTDKLLFGTDFHLIEMGKPTFIKDYFNNFDDIMKSLPDRDPFINFKTKLMYDNPREFLNI